MPEPLTQDERDHLLSLVGADPAVGKLLPDERELIPFLLGRLPGAAGEQLRALWYGRILGALGSSTRIGPDVSMVMPERIELDEAVSLEGRVHLDARGAGIRVGAHSEICYGSYLKNETAEGYIHIGKYSYIGAGGSIFGHRGVEIGDAVLIAPGVMIVPYQHRFERREQRVRDQGGTMARVVLEDDVYLGMSVRVLSGVTIGRGTVIGAGAVVTKDVPPYAVAVGVPARVMRYR